MSVRTVFKRLWNSSEKDNGTKMKTQVEDMPEYQPYNPFTELLFLEQHGDIIRILVKVDSKRCISAADDNLAIVWDIQFGYRQVTLTGHSRPITSILCLPAKRDHFQEVITGSSDKQIRIWNIDTGDCTKVITEHQTSVKALLLYQASTCHFCSGGEDICLWSRNGQLVTSLKQENESDENINLLITLKNDRIVTAADKNLGVYNIKYTEGSGQINLIKKLSPHREAVKSLINVTDDLFASGSIDGTIVLWKTDNLLPYCYFNSETDYLGPDKTFPYSVEHMICLEKRYIVTSVGSGFVIYDTAVQKVLLKKENAHHSKITFLTFACNGIYLLTAAIDGSIRLWSFIEMLHDIIQNDTINSFGLAHKPSEQGVYDMWWNMDKYQQSLSLVGECLAHSGSVQVLLDCDGESFVSCGGDGLIVVWKNQNIQMLKRSHVLQSLSHVCGGIV